MASTLGIEGLSKTILVDPLQGNLGVSREMRSNGLTPPLPGQASESASSFAKMLQGSIEQVNLQQAQADTAMKELIAGRSKNIHETMLTIERADTSLKLMMQVRNKILDAYREIMRMQV